MTNKPLKTNLSLSTDIHKKLYQKKEVSKKIKGFTMGRAFFISTS